MKGNLEDAKYERVLGETSPEEEMPMDEMPMGDQGMEDAPIDGVVPGIGEDPIADQVAAYFEQQSGFPAEMTMTIINAYKELSSTDLSQAGSEMPEEPKMSPLAEARLTQDIEE